ncbi:MAG: ferritin family protein [Fibrobacterota bacterium]
MQQLEREILDESVDLEFTISLLYFLFSQTFPQTSLFWGRLWIEEQDHANMLKSCCEMFDDEDIDTSEILWPDLDKVRAIDHRIRELIIQYEKNPPPLQEAFNTALQIEQAAEEYQIRVTEEKSDQAKGSQALEVVRRLNSDERSHARRIGEYMEISGLD